MSASRLRTTYGLYILVIVFIVLCSLLVSLDRSGALEIPYTFISLIYAIALFSIVWILRKRKLPALKTALISLKIPKLDFLLLPRFYFFLLVAITHSQLSLMKVAPAPFMHKEFSFLLYGAAHPAMTMFFVLSGYLMFKGFVYGKYQLDSMSIFQFYKNRLLRILPLFVLAQAFVFVVLQQRPSIGDLVLNLIFIDPSSPVIGALWSIVVEMQFYMIVPFLFILLRPLSSQYALRYLALTILCGVILKSIVFAISNSHPTWMYFAYHPLFANLDAFLAGFFIACLIKETDLKRHIGILKSHLIPVLFIASYFVFSYLDLNGISGMTWLFFAATPALAIIFSSAAIFWAEYWNIHFKSTNKALLLIITAICSLGAMTYHLYVIHNMLIQHFLADLGFTESESPFDLAYRGVFLLLITVASAYTFKYIIEDPLLLKIKKYGRQKS